MASVRDADSSGVGYACRISFSLPSSRDFQVIIDEPGAERLLRGGETLLMLEGKLTRLQGYFVDQVRIETLLRRISTGR